ILKQGSLLQLHWTLYRRHSQLPKSSTRTWECVIECVEEEEEEDSDERDEDEDEDEREIGGALTLSRNEIEDLMWDEREDSDDERVERTRY
ncbi:unnamed protein product, partial [Sphagnum compactum]